jgi:hypothetical protein
MCEGHPCGQQRSTFLPLLAIIYEYTVVVADTCLTIIIHLSVLLVCVFRSNIIMCFKVEKHAWLFVTVLKVGNSSFHFMVKMYLNCIIIYLKEMIGSLICTS